MITVSLTEFIDFLNKSGPAQLTKVKELLSKPEYDPRTDFWKALREAIPNFHFGKKTLQGVLPGLTDPKKVRRYPQAIKGYQKFMKKTHPKVFKVSPALWDYADLRVKVNPEIGFEIDNRRFAVKLYFKEARLTKQCQGAAFAVMKAAFRSELALIPAILDVCGARLLTPSSPEGTPLLYLEGQARLFVYYWKSLSSKAAGAGI